MQTEKPEETYVDDPPPILGTWKRLYIAVLVIHALIILGFYIFTQIYS
ncbi:MAG: hypothetical protein ACI8P3_002764 [Saprospiraceae bacterium]|jgi:hypothetical protein